MNSLTTINEFLIAPDGEPKVGVIVSTFIVFFMLLNGIVHLIMPFIWKGYSSMETKDKVDWCNRAVSALNSMYVSPMTLIVLMNNKTMHDDPMDGRSTDVIFYGSIVGAYFLYDTLWMIVFYKYIFQKDALVHHILGIACMFIGLVLQRMHMFGATLIVFLEITNPPLHVGRMIKQMKQEQHIANLLNGIVFVCSFFFFRVVMCTYYWYRLVQIAIEWNNPSDHLVYYGTFIYSGFCLLNMLWFSKVWRMFLRKLNQYLSHKSKASTKDEKND